MAGRPVRGSNLGGVLWMLAAVVTLTVMFAIIKQLAQELPVFVVALFRTGVGLLFFLPWLMRLGWPGVRTARLGAHFLRAFFGIAAFAALVYALGELILADAIVLSFSSPFWSILISAMVLGEVIRLPRALATAAGFIGVLAIVKPQGGIDPAMLAALASAVLVSAAMIIMKRLTATEPSGRIVFYFFFFGTLLLLPPAIATWREPTLAQLGWLVASGFLGATGQFFLTRAYDAAEVSFVAPFDFLRMPVAALIGFLVFAEIPDMWTALGTTIIIAASYYLVRREGRVRATRG
jgi:drug/metabolite transporter (DMT)-like permease